MYKCILYADNYESSLCNSNDYRRLCLYFIINKNYLAKLNFIFYFYMIICCFLYNLLEKDLLRTILNESNQYIHLFAELI